MTDFPRETKNVLRGHLWALENFCSSGIFQCILSSKLKEGGSDKLKPVLSLPLWWPHWFISYSGCSGGGCCFVFLCKLLAAAEVSPRSNSVMCGGQPSCSCSSLGSGRHNISWRNNVVGAWQRCRGLATVTKWHWFPGFLQGRNGK